MIEAVFRFDKHGAIPEVIISGHGGVSLNGLNAEKGNDILCAGVSVLVQGILIGLKYAADSSAVIIKKENGYLHFTVKDAGIEKNDVLLKTLYYALKELKKQYPENLKIEELR